MPEHDLVTLYGNVGRNPEFRLIAGREITRNVYDPVIDDFVERSFTTPSRELRTFTLAVSANDDDGNRVTRWIFCDDWDNHSFMVRKGFRVRVDGYFKKRTYTQDGETRTFRNFIVQQLAVLWRPAPPRQP